MYIANEEQKVLSNINRSLKTRFTSIEDMGDSLGIDRAVELLTEAYRQVEEQEVEKLERWKIQYQNKTSNRAKYLPVPVIRYFRNSKGVPTFYADTDLRCAGLIQQAVRHIHGDTAPAVFNILTPGLDPRDDGDKVLLTQGWVSATASNMVISGERLGWNKDSHEYRWLVKMFPIDIDFSAYNHSLNAPVLPEGFIPEVEVVFRAMEHNGINLGTDGSGIYHPECPEFAALVAKYGAVPFQFRYISKHGVFAKGMLFPSHEAIHHGRPAICVDWNQVKGNFKSDATTRREEGAVIAVEGFIGIINKWNNPGQIQGGFEMLENIQRSEVTEAIVEKMVNRAMNNLKRKGIVGLVESIGKEDSTIARMAKLVLAMQTQGVEFEITQIPRVREAVYNKLQKHLYWVAQGAGIKFNRYVARMDNTVPVGCVVVTGIEPGTTVVAFRFPMVLAQGLVTLKVIPAPAHLTNGGEEIPYQVVMNPHDLGTKMQGDDDGDTVGISTDPEMVELFSHLVDNRVYHIEPNGIKRSVPTNSLAGEEYIRYDQRGDVGRTTVYRSELLAAGFIMQANAMSVSIQENIDKAKRMPRWTSFYKAASIDNWKQDDRGEYHISTRLPEKFWEQNFPTGMAAVWTREHLCEVGAAIAHEYNGKTRYKSLALGWRYDDKKIPVDDWVTTSERTGWDGGNLVHFSHDVACRIWRQLQIEFSMVLKDPCWELENLQEMWDSLNEHERNESQIPYLMEKIKEEIKIAEAMDVSPLLNALSDITGINAISMTDKQYQYGLRRKSGLTEFAKKMAELLNTDFGTGEHQEEEVYNRRRGIEQTFTDNLIGLTPQELITCWEHEISNDNLNYAFRAVCFPGSPILAILNIEEQENCPFLFKNFNNVPRWKFVVNQALQAPEPELKLREIITNSTVHEQEIEDEEGNGVPGHACEFCTEWLQTSLVRAIRNNRKRHEHQAGKDLVKALKANLDTSFM